MPTKTIYRLCPICDSSNRELLHTQLFQGYLTHEIFCCKDCKFVYVGNTPPESFYDKYYSQESKYEGVRQHEDHETVTKSELSKFLPKNVKTSAKVLDIGCSTGSLLSYIKKKGYSRVYGIDPAPKCRIEAKKQYGLDVGTFDIKSFNPKHKYDLIILSQVLEHLTDLKGSISRISSWLSQDGYIFIGVPNSEKFALAFDEPFGEFSTEHINFFTKTSLSALMNNFSSTIIRQKDNVLLSVWKKASTSRDSIIDYIKSSKMKQVKIQKIIDRLPEKSIVWGVGALTRRLLSTTNLRDKTLLFIDSNPNLIGKSIDGIMIYSPEILREYNRPILISSFKFRHEIVSYIKAHKYKNSVLSFL